MGGGLDPAAGATTDTEIDCPAYSRIGLGGIICELLPPRLELKIARTTAISGTAAQVWITPEHPLLIQGTGIEATPQVE